MAKPIGRTAVVIGAGIGGLSAAAAVSEFFSQVIVLERDELPDHPAPRPSVAQGRHPHLLLVGGLRALEQLFPGFGDDLAAAGAVRYQVGIDIRIERPEFHPYPQRDFGLHSYAMSRPLIEFVARRRAAQLSNVTLRFDGTLMFAAALTRLAAREPETHKLMTEVQHFLRSSDAYREPALMQRIKAEMASA